ncbi:hypothetical protein [Rhizobium sp. SL42]|uniref:hypothetical protein n=1 Tax=Rhizobium sp. SL42 TaxID=2806346 RepID=UPI001F1C476F|nr:hypothetical protein [Rhizobium sp. SL42]UJW75547.1 hypothetical protein IM739_03315 [Rhizobium sp. SL42]
MTEASFSLLETVSRDLPMYRDDPESQLASFPDGVDDDALHSDQDESDSKPSYAPANWLDAFTADERSHSGNIAPRIASPSDDAGLYQMHMKPMD